MYVPRICIIQGSLKPASRTAIVIDEVVTKLKKKKNVKIDIIDLRKIDMQFCDGRDLKDYNKDMRAAHATMEKADGYIFGMPVYQYSISGPLKNFLDIVSSAMSNKTAGIVCNSGGVRSYLASVELMKILSFEENVTTVQPTVHTWVEDFASGKIHNEDIHARIDKMIEALLKALL